MKASQSKNNPDGESSRSVAMWFKSLRAGNSAAATKLWDAYCDRVKSLARKMLRNASRKSADESDIAASVLESVLMGATEGRFKGLASRQEMWWLLVTITHQKVVNEIRRQLRQKAGSGKVRAESELHNGYSEGFDLQEIVDDKSLPEAVVALEDEQTRLLSLLKDDQCREIARLRLLGYTQVEAAGILGIAERTVIRKCKLILDRWKKELPTDERRRFEE